jgi:hypothetical protein
MLRFVSVQKEAIPHAFLEVVYKVSHCWEARGSSTYGRPSDFVDGMLPL